MMEEEDKEESFFTNVLPVFLQKRNKEVDTHLNILKDLLLLHVKVPNSDTHAKNLLELELHCRLGLIHFGFQRLLVAHKSRELSCLFVDSKE